MGGEQENQKYGGQDEKSENTARHRWNSLQVERST